MFEPIKNVLNRVLADRQQKSVFDAAEICSVAGKLFVSEFPQLEGKFVVRSVKGRVLQLAALNSSVAGQLRMAELTVLGELQKRYPLIKHVRYSIQPLDTIEETHD